MRSQLVADPNAYFKNPVRELHDFYSVKTYLCHYIRYVKLYAADKGDLASVEMFEEDDTLLSYIHALKHWSRMRTWLPAPELFMAALSKAYKAQYQFSLMNKETFKKLIDSKNEPESILIYHFSPMDFSTVEKSSIIKQLRDSKMDKNWGLNHICHQLHYN